MKTRLCRRTTGLMIATLLLGAAGAPLHADYNYSLEDDWLTIPNQSNTATDLWQYYGQIDTANRNGSYTLQPTFWNPLAGLESWVIEAKAGSPNVAKNNTDSPMDLGGGGVVPAHAVWVHPDQFSPDAVAAAFYVPVSGTYKLDWQLTDISVGSGDGVSWFLDRNSGITGNLASGSFGDGGNSGPLTLTTDLNAFDRVYLIVGKKSTWDADSTRLVFNAYLIPEPSTGLLTLLGTAALLLRRRRGVSV